jgi:hypothetical protein
VWFARGIFLALFLLAGASFATRSAKADITYTWDYDSGSVYAGSMTVKGSAQSAGEIQLTDVLTFSFTTPEGSITQPSQLIGSDFPLRISSTDASPTPTAQEMEAQAGTLSFNVEFDKDWSMPKYENAFDSTGSSGHFGQGHWTITGATISSVPEPSSAVLAAIGAVAILAYGWSRHRREQRRQAAA